MMHYKCLFLYIDDIIIIALDSKAMEGLIDSLHNEFSLKDLYHLHYFHGIALHKLVDGSMLLNLENILMIC